MSPFDLLVADLVALDKRRETARLTAQRQQQAAYRQRQHAELMKAIAAPPVDFTPIHREQTRLQARIADDHEQTARRQCASTLAELTAAAKAGRLTGIEAGKLDALRGRFGAMATPFTPPLHHREPPRPA